jgi:hypothetical protein
MTYSFRFCGGCSDGKTIRTDSSEENERTIAEAFVLMTHDGEVGRRVVGMSDAAIASLGSRSSSDASPQAHVYEVAERLIDEEGCVCIRMTYAGISP